MKKNLKIFFISLFACVNCFGQNDSNNKKTEDGLVDLILQTRNKMNEDNIKDYFILSHSYFTDISTDYIEKGETVKTEIRTINDFVAYIFWKNNNKCFVKYINREKSSQAVEFNNCDFIKIDQKLIDKISKEKILPVLIEIHEGEKVILDKPIHSKTRFYFATGQSSLFPYYYLDNLNKENLNYSKNNKLATNKLYQACQKIIKEKSKELFY